MRIETVRVQLLKTKNHKRTFFKNKKIEAYGYCVLKTRRLCLPYNEVPTGKGLKKTLQHRKLRPFSVNSG